MKSHGFCVSHFIACSVVLWCSFQWAMIQPAESARNQDNKEDEYDFSWLDPDKKVYVLQNRKFRKDGRMMLSLMPGLGLSEPYRETVNVEPRLGFFFSESLGVEVFYTYFKSSANSASDALDATITSTGASFPVIRDYQSQIGAIFQWVPWYAKINVFNTILYFDWYFSAGGGQIKYSFDNNRTVGNPEQIVNRSKTGFYLGTGHHYHLNQNWGVRLDLMGAFYRARVFENSGDGSWYSNFNFSFGVGYRI